MAFTSLLFEDPGTGRIKEAPVGFSWTTLLFGFFPALFRGNWKWAFLIFLFGIMTLGLSALVFTVIYNKLYIRDLVRAGFKARPLTDLRMEMVQSHLGMQLPLAETMPQGI